MKKQKCLVYGCGEFYEKNKSVIEEKYEIVDILDRYSENASIHDLLECTKDYTIVLIMLEKVGFIFEAIHYLFRGGINEKNIILGFSEYSCLGKGIDMQVLDDEGICITIESQQKVVYDDKEFWEFYHSEVVDYLEKKGGD